MTMTTLVSPTYTIPAHHWRSDKRATQKSAAAPGRSGSLASSLRDFAITIAIFGTIAVGAVVLKTLIWLPNFIH
jgi:hypothetical protein